MTSLSPRTEAFPCCRSQSISQALQASLAEIEKGSQPKSSSADEAFLEELHTAVDSLQSSKSKAGDAVARLEQLPGRLQKAGSAYSALMAEAQWLMGLVSSSSLPGA